MNEKKKYLVLLVLVYTGLSYIISKQHASFKNKHTNSNETFMTNNNNANHFGESCLINWDNNLFVMFVSVVCRYLGVRPGVLSTN